MNILQTLTNALDKITEPAKPRNYLYYDWVSELFPEAKVTADDIRDGRTAKAEWAAAFEGTKVFTEAGARMRFAKQFENGQDHTQEGVRTRGLESFISENAGKQAACKAKMAQASRDAAKVFNSIIARLRPAAVALLDERVKAEVAEAKRFGLARVPAAATTALAEFVNQLQPRDTNSTGKPEDMFFFIDLN
jgi:hypothetical protein